MRNPDFWREKGKNPHSTFTESVNHLLYHLGFPQQALLDSHDPQFTAHYRFPAVLGRRAFPFHRLALDGGRISQIAIILRLDTDCVVLEIAESANPGVEIRSIIGQIFWGLVSCAQIISLVILTPGTGMVTNGTFPVGGRNVPEPEHIAGGEVRKDVVCRTVADEGMKGEQGLEDNLLECTMRRQHPSNWGTISAANAYNRIWFLDFWREGLTHVVHCATFGPSRSDEGVQVLEREQPMSGRSSALGPDSAAHSNTPWSLGRQPLACKRL